MTTPSPGGNVDTKLFGLWKDDVDFFSYFFYEDGKFECYYEDFQLFLKSTGNYQVSGGRILLTNVHNGNNEYSDTTLEYQFGKDDKGDYLLIGQYVYNSSYIDISSGYKFRKAV